jgi:hypothetical protein
MSARTEQKEEVMTQETTSADRQRAHAAFIEAKRKTAEALAKQQADPKPVQALQTRDLNY